MMAIVSGSLMMIWLSPARLGLQIHAAVDFRMFVRTTSMPTPRPDTSVTFSAVLNPGRKIRLRISRCSIVASSASLIRPLANAFSLIFST